MKDADREDGTDKKKFCRVQFAPPVLATAVYGNFFNAN